MSEAAMKLSECCEQNPLDMSAPAEKRLVDIPLFSRISGELTAFLSELSDKVQKSAEQLEMMDQAVERKAEELKRLHEIDAATATLEQLMEDQQRQKEQFEKFIAAQRELWDQEKFRRIQENEEYMERLQLQRQSEEEEYRLRWASEQAKAKQELIEELQEIQTKCQANQASVEQELLQRELLLKEKETEWMQLVQELEQFMSKLGRSSLPTGS
jgi:hypothetical protein